MLTQNGMTPADISAIVGGNGGNGWTDGGGWLWFIIVIFALFGGWGNGGFGNSAGSAENYTLASDFATLQRQIDTATSDLKTATTSIGNGISSLGYDQLNQMNGINSNISSSGYAIQNAIQQDVIANMQNTNSLTAQLNSMSATQAQCCCENKQAISNAVQTIMANDNANYRALHDEIVANRVEDLKAQIANQQAEIQALNLTASQQSQNAYLIGQLRPSPVPAYTVSAPYYYGYGTTIG